MQRVSRLSQLPGPFGGGAGRVAPSIAVVVHAAPKAEASATAPVRRGSGPANPVTIGVVTAMTEALRVLGVG